MLPVLPMALCVWKDAEKIGWDILCSGQEITYFLHRHRIPHPTIWAQMDCPAQATVSTVYLKKYAHGFVVLCFVVVMQSFIMNSHEVFIHIHQGCFAGTGATVRLPQCQWSKPDGYGKISQCITTTKHSKAKTVCIFLGIYCMLTIMKQQWKYMLLKHLAAI